jgi:TonB family protein
MKSCILALGVLLAAGYAVAALPLTEAPVSVLEHDNAAQGEASRNAPLRIGANVLESRLLHKVDPIYPAQAKREETEGTVKLTVTVNEEGAVYEIRPDPANNSVLEKAAIAAVKKWNYSPVLLNGAPVPVIATVTVVFRLQDAVSPDQTQNAPSEIKAPKSKPLRIGGDGPKPVFKVAPLYPEEARKAKIQGSVMLDVTVNEDGLVYDVRTMQGNSLLAKAATAAVKQWEFGPTLLNGKPVPIATTVSVTFDLKQR